MRADGRRKKWKDNPPALRFAVWHQFAGRVMPCLGGVADKREYLADCRSMIDNQQFVALLSWWGRFGQPNQSAAFELDAVVSLSVRFQSK